MDRQVTAALNDAFPDREVGDLAPAGPSWNESNRTMRVEFADGAAAYLKVASDGDGSRIARERAVIEHVRANSDVQVPEVLACDPHGAVPYLATAPLPGRNLAPLWTDASVAERETLARAVGGTLADLHAIPVDEHGHVVGGDAGRLDVDTGPWTDVLLDRIGYIRELSPSDRFDHHFDEVSAAVEANRDLLDDAPAALVHGDPAKPNCLYGDADVGLVDWELAHVGDPARELVRTEDQLVDSLREDRPIEVAAGLYEGYIQRVGAAERGKAAATERPQNRRSESGRGGSLRDSSGDDGGAQRGVARGPAGGLPDGFLERQPVYEAVSLLGVSGFFEKWAAFVDESIDELATWLEGEMDRRLTAIV